MAVLDAAKRLERYDFSEPPQEAAARAATSTSSTTLADTIDAYLEENRRASSWTDKTAEKKVALDLLLELRWPCRGRRHGFTAGRAGRQEGPAGAAVEPQQAP